MNGVRDVTERCRRVRLLLSTCNDAYPRPNDSLGGLAGHLSGPAPSRRVPCPSCARTGYVAGGRLCLNCGGSGWRRRLKGEDPYDEYTGLPISDVASSASHAAPFRLEDDYRKIGVELDRIQSTVDSREGVYADAYGWEKAREAWERLGSYRELRRALGRLQGFSPEGYGVLRSVWLMDVPVTMIGKIQQVEQASIIWVQDDMRGEIKVPPWLMEDVFSQRRSTFEQLVSAGKSASQIARDLGLPKKRVKKMLKTSRPVLSRG